MLVNIINKVFNFYFMYMLIKKEYSERWSKKEDVFFGFI